MANVDRKWLPPVLIAVVSIASALVYTRLPRTVDLRLDGLLPFRTTQTSDSGPRWLVLFLMPAVALVMWVAFRWASTAAGQRVARRMFRSAPEEVTDPAQFERFGKTYDTIVLAVVLLVLGFHTAMLAAAFQATTIASRIVPVVLGACLILMGNVMPRLRPNWVAGLRTTRILADPQLWRRTHRVFGNAFVTSGLVTIIAAVVAPRYGLLVGIGSVLVSCLIGFIASRRQGGTPSHAAHAVFAAIGLLCSAANAIVGQTPAGMTPPVELNTPASVAESPFSFVRNGLTLNGTLAVPRAVTGRIPVVVIVAGSGPTDRNGNGPLTNTNAYAMLAWGLADQAIASMRYDKRGMGKSAGSGGDPATLSTEDYVADVAAAAAALASDARFSRIILLGHSEGAGHVLQAANRGAPAAGVIMVAPQGRRLADVLHEQFARQTDSATVARIDSALSRFLRGDDPGEVPPLARSVIIPVYRNFLRSLAAYDPPSEARRYAGALLIIQGTTDVQVTLRDAELLQAAQPRATVLRLDGVNHVLKSVESTDLQAQRATYRNPSMPLARSVVPAVARWIAESTR